MQQKTGVVAKGCLGFIIFVVVIGIVSGITSDGKSSSSSSTAPAEPYASKYEGQEAVKKILKDPESAQFDGVYVHTKGSVSAVCGSVNAKNGFGGYTGKKAFFAIGSQAFIESSENISQFYDLWNAACTDEAPKAKKKR